jgi:hypothetical protein
VQHNFQLLNPGNGAIGNRPVSALLWIYLFFVAEITAPILICSALNDKTLILKYLLL